MLGGGVSVNGFANGTHEVTRCCYGSGGVYSHVLLSSYVGDQVLLQQ